MTKTLRLGAGLAMALMSMSPAFAEGETASTVIAKVNDTEITLGQLLALRESLPPQYAQLPEDVLFKGLVDQLVQQEVLAQNVAKQSARDTANIMNAERGYLASVAIENMIATAVSEDALKKAYDDKYANAVPAKEYNAAHILVDSEEKANELKAKLDAGADFAELAKENSLDTGSGARGGALGWFGLGMMVQPFEEAVVAAEVGKVTAPVQSDFGWHIILVTEARDQATPTLEQVSEALAVELENAAVEAELAKLTEAAKVERPGDSLDPSILQKSDLID